MDQNLGVPFDSLIELVVRDLGILDADLVADDEARLGFTSDDQVTEVPVVLLYIALTRG